MEHATSVSITSGGASIRLSKDLIACEKSRVADGKHHKQGKEIMTISYSMYVFIHRRTKMSNQERHECGASEQPMPRSSSACVATLVLQ